MNKQDTICAIATATGGALGIIRISGDESIAIASKIFTPKGYKKAFSEIQHNTAAFGEIKNEDGSTLDEVIAVSFKAPHSYTGEDSVEFSCHGSLYILNRVMQMLISEGCRLANPGEFTERAFLNGKMDLSQAEAVVDLIASRSETSHRVAMNQLKGGFKDRINMLRDKLKDIQSLLELELDFSDHDDLDFAERPVLISKAEDIQKEIQSLLHSFTSMNAVKNGVPVAITGKTNVGKSTLMNALLSDSRAIVSNIPGTTRDTIEERIIIKGIEFRLIDTAGIRKTDDVIENLGIDKTFKVIDTALIIIWVVSAPEVLENDMKDATDELGTILESGKTLITVINKADIIPDKSSLEKIESRLSAYIRSIIKTTSQENPDKETEPVFVITSAKKRAGIDQLEDTLVKVINSSKTNSSDSIVINERHYQALSKASKNMDDVISGLKNLMPADLVSQDLREMLLNLSTISGEITSQEILNNIFSHFCIGK